jgi:predicted DNA-binding transcriptional regulator AlpA
MNQYKFSLIIKGIDTLTRDHVDALYAAGCDDAILGARDGAQFADFERTAPTLPAALSSAIETVEATLPGAQVVRVTPDDLVNLTEIATRTGRSKESIRLLSEGRRGPGNFPAPVAWVSTKHRIWQWADVVEWFAQAFGEQLAEGEAAQFVAALNGALEVRWRGSQLSSDEERAEVAKVLEKELAELG